MPTQKEVADEVVRRLKAFEQYTGEVVHPLELTDITAISGDSDTNEGCVAVIVNDEEFFLEVHVA